MALFAYIIFFLLAIIGRVILQYRLTGDHGLRALNSQASLIKKISTILFLVSFLSSFTLTFFFTLNKYEFPLHFGSLTDVTGGLLCSSGIIVTIIAQYQMGIAWRIGVDENEKTDLITHGLYKYSRNPIYSGAIVFGFGILIFIPNAYMLFSLILGYIGIELLVRYTEEPYLVQLHGIKYEAYASKVNRFFPKVVNLAIKS